MLQEHLFLAQRRKQRQIVYIGQKNYFPLKTMRFNETSNGYRYVFLHTVSVFLTYSIPWRHDYRLGTISSLAEIGAQAVGDGVEASKPARVKSRLTGSEGWAQRESQS
jgi:outer membrane receptor for Fe3+-dicitrate